MDANEASRSPAGEVELESSVPFGLMLGPIGIAFAVLAFSVARAAEVDSVFSMIIAVTVLSFFVIPTIGLVRRLKLTSAALEIQTIATTKVLDSSSISRCATTYVPASFFLGILIWRRGSIFPRFYYCVVPAIDRSRLAKISEALEDFGG